MTLLALPKATVMGELAITNTGGSFTGVMLSLTVALVLDGEVARLSVAVTEKLDCENRATSVALTSVGSTELL